jgi:tetratricopeptide (TPR) repeat protein
MRRYTLAEASRLLRMPRRVVDALVASGFVTPGRGPRGRPDIGFQDLVVLRAAQSLVAARVPSGRIARTLAGLRRQVPEVPPARLRVEAVGRSIVVRESDRRYLADSGQYLLAFDVAARQGEVRYIGRADDLDADAWLARAVALEDHDAEGAVEAYRRAIAADATRPAGYANLGRLLHALGQAQAAATAYEGGLAHAQPDATLHFNYAVLLEEGGRLAEAVEHYRRALGLEPAFADAHCNLGLLYERLGQPQGALRHLRTYRQLARK